MTISLPIAFTEQDLDRIIVSLPKGTISHRLALLANVLNEWAEHDLPEYAASMSSRAASSQLSKRCKRLITSATKLSEALDDTFKFSDDFYIALALGESEGRIPNRDRLTHYTNRLVDHRKFIEALVTSAPFLWKQSQSARGRPSNKIAYVVLSDLASIFEWVAMRKATRNVDRICGAETGEFHLFASAVWPLIFQSAGDGLPATMKKWATFREQEKSALIANINLRYPLWRVFDK